MNIRTYQPGDESDQAAIYNEAAGDFPKFKPANVEEVRRRCRARDFDPASRFYAEESGRVVGYATFMATGRVSYPWCRKGHEAAAEALFQQVLTAMTKRGMGSAFAAYRHDWPVSGFFVQRGFHLARAMKNFVLDLTETPTTTRLSIPPTPMRSSDIPAIMALAPMALRGITAQQLERHLFQNPYFPPESAFVFRGKEGNSLLAVGILIDDPSYGDPKLVDANMPCFRLGAFGTEGMTTKRLRGLFSFLARDSQDVIPLGLDLMSHASTRLEQYDLSTLAAQVASDVPHLLSFYQRYFRYQGSFPVFERSLSTKP